MSHCWPILIIMLCGLPHIFFFVSSMELFHSCYVTVTQDPWIFFHCFQVGTPFPISFTVWWSVLIIAFCGWTELYRFLLCECHKAPSLPLSGPSVELFSCLMSDCNTKLYSFLLGSFMTYSYFYVMWADTHPVFFHALSGQSSWLLFGSFCDPISFLGTRLALIEFFSLLFELFRIFE